MNIFHIGSRMLSRSSPVLLAATGAAVVLAFPPVRRGLRSAAVLATKGALMVSDKVKDAAAKMRENAESIMQEAREKEDCNDPCPAVKAVGTSVKNKSRKMAVSTTAGLLALKEQAKSAREEWNSIVNEAKELRTAPFVDNKAQPPELNSEKKTGSFSNGLEGEIPDIGPS